MTRDEIRAAFAEADARVESLRDAILASPEAPLIDNDWRVRDALSHVAARANSVPIALTWLDRVSGTAQGQTPPDIHEINAGEIAGRTALSPAELVDEVIAGHRAALERLDTIDDDTLAKAIVVPTRNIDTTFAPFVVLAGPGHERNHLADIEAALAAAKEPSN